MPCIKEADTNPFYISSQWSNNKEVDRISSLPQEKSNPNTPSSNINQINKISFEIPIKDIQDVPSPKKNKQKLLKKSTAFLR